MEKAVSNKNGKTILYCQGKIGANRIAEVNRRGDKTFEVETIRIDDFYRGKVNMIKIDIEGAEIMALEGMKELLTQKPKMIIEESPELIEFLNKNGFKFSKIDDRNLVIS